MVIFPIPAHTYQPFPYLFYRHLKGIFPHKYYSIIFTANVTICKNFFRSSKPIFLLNFIILQLRIKFRRFQINPRVHNTWKRSQSESFVRQVGENHSYSSLAGDRVVITKTHHRIRLSHVINLLYRDLVLVHSTLRTTKTQFFLKKKQNDDTNVGTVTT